uniref:Uncharacterized protein n=1 Tax=Oryza sativa subsp. japonica TaxID=39947 RepID=Q84NP1_ORYSJ|nr:hypothetical protein [Oryza sativa Japonica Group]
MAAYKRYIYGGTLKGITIRTAGAPAQASGNGPPLRYSRSWPLLSANKFGSQLNRGSVRGDRNGSGEEDAGEQGGEEGGCGGCGGGGEEERGEERRGHRVGLRPPVRRDVQDGEAAREVEWRVEEIDEAAREHS